MQGGHSIEGAKEDLSLCCADSVVIKAERFVDKNAIETAFSFYTYYLRPSKKVRKEGMLFQVGRLYDIMAQGVGAYLG